MFDLYLATREYMRLTASIPIPFNIIPLIADIAYFLCVRFRAERFGLRVYGLRLGVTSLLFSV